jgi:hypothetical protein
MYAIFSVKKENVNKIREVLKDDLISRQSIVIRDANTLGINKDVRYVLIEGEKSALERASEIFKEKEIGTQVQEPESSEIYNKFKEEELNVADGVGTIFDI